MPGQNDDHSSSRAEAHTSGPGQHFAGHERDLPHPYNVMMTSFDVIVAAAGPAGSTAAGEPATPGPSPAVFAIQRGESTCVRKVEALPLLASATRRFAGSP